MDYNKKKLLTQSVAFLQTHLVLTTELLEALKANGVLTAEEATIIQKDETTSGKVVELVCLVKRKDNRTFSRFVQVLEDKHCTAVANLLRGKIPGASVSEVVTPDPRTVHFLEQSFSNSSVNIRALNDAATGLILIQHHQDEVNALQDKLNAAQASLRGKSRQTGANTFRSDSGTFRSDSGNFRSDSGSSSDRSTPTKSPTDTDRLSSARPAKGAKGMNKWDLQDTEELHSLIDQKDIIIRVKDEEYSKLRTILEDTQNDLEGVLELNSHYLTIVSKLNEMQMNSNPSSPQGLQQIGADTDSVEYKLEASRAKIRSLQSELADIADDMEGKEKELERVLNREYKYKEQLGLEIDASEDEVSEKIKVLMSDGSVHRAELSKIKKELDKAKFNKVTLEGKVQNLIREKEKVEFHLRQQDLTIKKMKRIKSARGTIQAAEKVLTTNDRMLTQLRLPAIEPPGCELSLASSKASRFGQQYCMFCRTEFQPLKSQHCRAHFRPIRGGRWTCCQDDCHRSAGCLQMPHLYIEITVDRKLFITDGARYMELT